LIATGLIYVHVYIDSRDDMPIPFPSGIWSSSFKQLNVWFGPHDCYLKFHSDGRRVTGRGVDDAGAFTLSGTYSSSNGRMNLQKQYRNAHLVTLKLKWSATDNAFRGSWKIGPLSSGDYALWFVRTH
jgi:hypothetical protein